MINDVGVNGMLSDHKCQTIKTPVFKIGVINHSPCYGTWVYLTYVDIRKIYTYLSDGVPECSKERYRAFEPISPDFHSKEEMTLWCDMNVYKEVSSEELILEMRKLNDVAGWEHVYFGTKVSMRWDD